MDFENDANYNNIFMFYDNRDEIVCVKNSQKLMSGVLK